MKEFQRLSHRRWDCKYHVVFIQKRRKKQIFGAVRRHLGEMLHELAGHKGSKIPPTRYKAACPLFFMQQ